jgi:hypothetical protein
MSKGLLVRTVTITVISEVLETLKEWEHKVEGTRA